MTSLHDAYVTITRDLARLTVRCPDLTLLDRTSGQQVGAPDPHLATEAIEEPEPRETLVRSGARVFRVSGADSAAELTVQIMSPLQDDVMDLLGRPWHQLTVDGAFVGVLEPAVEHDVPVWRSPQGYSCPIGRLDQGFGHLVQW